MNPSLRQRARRWLHVGVRLLLRVAAFAGALLLFAAALRVGASLAFPFAGHEFHALLRAASRSARKWAALQALVAYAVALASMAGVLVLARYPLSVSGVYYACVVVGALAYWRVCQLMGLTVRWAIVCGFGVVAMTVVVGVVVCAAESVRERLSARRRSAGALPEPPPPA